MEEGGQEGHFFGENAGSGGRICHRADQKETIRRHSTGRPGSTYGYNFFLRHLLGRSHHLLLRPSKLPLRPIRRMPHPRPAADRSANQHRQQHQTNNHGRQGLQQGAKDKAYAERLAAGNDFEGNDVAAAGGVGGESDGAARGGSSGAGGNDATGSGAAKRSAIAAGPSENDGNVGQKSNNKKTESTSRQSNNKSSSNKRSSRSTKTRSHKTGRSAGDGIEKVLSPPCWPFSDPSVVFKKSSHRSTNTTSRKNNSQQSSSRRCGGCGEFAIIVQRRRTGTHHKRGRVVRNPPRNVNLSWQCRTAIWRTAIWGMERSAIRGGRRRGHRRQEGAVDGIGAAGRWWVGRLRQVRCCTGRRSMPHGAASARGDVGMGMMQVLVAPLSRPPNRTTSPSYGPD